jgi:hypothetical protein
VKIHQSVTPDRARHQDRRKTEIRKRLCRSPDDGDAIVMGLRDGARAVVRLAREQRRADRPERANLGQPQQ